MWREGQLDIVNELTSFNLQAKSWLDEGNNSRWLFIEFMCTNFKDLFLNDNYQYVLKNGWITDEELENVSEQHEALDKYHSQENDD